MAQARAKQKNTALVVDAKKKLDYLDSYLTERDEIIHRVCAGVFSAERLRWLTISICRRTPALLKCQPFSFVNALMDAAFFGIEPNPQLAEGYIIPFKDHAQFIAGYRGKRNLVINHGYATDMQPIAVYDKDEFKVARHLAWEKKAPFTHFEYPDEDRGELKAVYTVTMFEDGHLSFHWLPRKGKGSVDYYRSKSRAQKDGPWVDAYEAMALKTVVHRTCEQLPRKPGSMLGAAIKQENSFEEGAPMHAYQFDEKTGEVAPQLAQEVDERPPPPRDDDAPQGSLL
jgi:recombination protein RecT